MSSTWAPLVPSCSLSSPISLLPICADGQIKWSRTNNGNTQNRVTLSVWTQLLWDLTGFLRERALQMRPHYRDLLTPASGAGGWIFCSKTVNPVNFYSYSDPWNVKCVESPLWMSLSLTWFQQATNLLWFMKQSGCFPDAFEIIHENLNDVPFVRDEPQPW